MQTIVLPHQQVARWCPLGTSESPNFLTSNRSRSSVSVTAENPILSPGSGMMLGCALLASLMKRNIPREMPAVWTSILRGHFVTFSSGVSHSDVTSWYRTLCIYSSPPGLISAFADPPYTAGPGFLLHSAPQQDLRMSVYGPGRMYAAGLYSKDGAERRCGCSTEKVHRFETMPGGNAATSKTSARKGRPFGELLKCRCSPKTAHPFTVYGSNPFDRCQSPPYSRRCARPRVAASGGAVAGTGFPS